MSDLSREAVDAALLKRLDATLRSSLREAGLILRERGVDNGALWAATQALVPILNLLRDLNSSGAGGVARAHPPAACEASPAPDSRITCPKCGGHGWPTAYDGCDVCHGNPLPAFADPLAEEEASKASAPKGPADAVVIQLDQLRQRAAKLARHDNERKPL